MTSNLHLILRAVIDCAYLVRSGLSRRNKRRILVEYARLTLKTMIRRDPAGGGTDRVLDYEVRHFGIGSLQFLFREIFVRNEYFFESPAARPLVFDCGANIGLATLFFTWLHPDCEIHAFEPDPVTFQALSDNVRRNRLTNVHLYNIALADTAGPLDFFVPAGSDGSPLMSTVSRRSVEAAMRRIVVNAGPLSAYVDGREIDFLKMDIEGAEERVLRELNTAGGLRHVKEMALEYHHNLEGGTGGCGSFLRLLQDAGFQFQLDATWGGDLSPGVFQDVLVRARRLPRLAAHRAATADHQEAVA